MKICKKCKSKNIKKHENIVEELEYELSTGIKIIKIEGINFYECVDCEYEYLTKRETALLKRKIKNVLKNKEVLFTELELKELMSILNEESN